MVGSATKMKTLKAPVKGRLYETFGYKYGLSKLLKSQAGPAYYEKLRPVCC